VVPGDSGSVSAALRRKAGTFFAPRLFYCGKRLLSGIELAELFEELIGAGGGEVEEVVELGAGEGDAFGGGLDFDEVAVFGEDDVGVNVGARVFFVAEVEEEIAVHVSGRDRGDVLAEWELLEDAGSGEAMEGKRECGGGSGDGGGAGSSVGLEDIAVNDDAAFAEEGEVDDGAERAADEALDFVGATGDFAAFGFAGGAGEGGAGEHAVFGGDPAEAGVATPGGDAGFE
jgi:hypothetical protein